MSWKNKKLFPLIIIGFGLILFSFWLLSKKFFSESDPYSPESFWPTVTFEANSFYLRPMSDSSNIALYHSAFPSSYFTFSIPEYAYQNLETGKGVRAEGIQWNRVKKNHYTFSWEASDEEKEDNGIDFWGELVASSNRVVFSLRAKNVSDQVWSVKGPYHAHLLCLACGKNPAFIDPNGERAFMREGNQWESLAHKQKGQPARRSLAYPLINQKPVAVKQSKDDDWFLSLTATPAQTISYCLVERVSCMHVNPDWGLLKPGEEKTVNGKIEIFKTSMRKLWDQMIIEPRANEM
ncbi:MAG: hypothetical protein HQL32_02205 [Planctomycetes bacterium]|nr:hypothetical protein [Planctomycetota bacterium]